MPNWPFLLSLMPLRNQGFFISSGVKLGLSTSYDAYEKPSFFTNSNAKLTLSTSCDAF
jgi:hypothetical protein